jgi:hypothetical protein
MFWSHYQPSIEIVDEFKVQTNGFSAQYGRNGGSVIHIIGKSGTNQIHGSGYWFGQRPALNANDFFANKNGNPKPDYARDQFGGTIGGPIKKTAFSISSTMTAPAIKRPLSYRPAYPRPLRRMAIFLRRSIRMAPCKPFTIRFQPSPCPTDPTSFERSIPEINSRQRSSILSPSKFSVTIPAPPAPGSQF